MNIVSISNESAVVDLDVGGILYRLNIGGLSGIDNIEEYLQTHEADYVEDATKHLENGVGLCPAPTPEQLAATARAERDQLIKSVRWRIERHNDELALGREPTEPLEPLLQYVQSLRDVPQQTGFPTDIIWPELPSVE